MIRFESGLMDLTAKKKAILLKVTKHFWIYYYSPISIKKKIETFKAENPVQPNLIVVERSIMKSKTCS